MASLRLPTRILLLSLTLVRPSRAEPSPEGRAPETTARLVVGWLWSGLSVEGLSLRAQVFHRVGGDGSPDFYDLGGELAWESGGPRASLGTRHRMYFVPDARFEQSVLLGVRLVAVPHLDLSGSFAFHQPVGPLAPARLAPGVHALWRLSTPASSLRVEPRLGLGVGLAGLFP